MTTLCLDCRHRISRGSRCLTCQARHRPRALQRQFRSAVLTRDRACVDCGATAHLEADHVVPLARGGSFALANGAARCHDCHARKTTVDRRGGAR